MTNEKKMTKWLGLALIIVVAISTLLSGLNATRQAQDSAKVQRIATCQSNVSSRLAKALADRDELTSLSSTNLDTLIKGLTTRGPADETQTDRVTRAGMVLANYYKEAKRISDLRQSITLPSAADIEKCQKQ